MPRPRPFPSSIGLALLALWLGLWPAADAVTGASWIVIVEPATATAGERCPLPTSFADASRAPACCPLNLSLDAADAGCCERERARCGRCFTVGGMVLFAVARWTPQDDLPVSGTVRETGMVAPSRHLQPPVPPPWTVS